jgi:hypothetical protein
MGMRINMSDTETNSLPAVKYEVIVQNDGSISLNVPFSPGKRVIVFVVQEPELSDDFIDLVQASESSTEFWDNSYDDEDWNNA